MSDLEHSVITYTSISNNYKEPSDVSSPGVVVYGYDRLPMHPPSLDYVLGPEHPPSPDYVPGPEHPPSPIYVPYAPTARHTGGFRADYRITDTWDEMVEAMQEIAPATLERVNQRVTDLVTTVRQDTNEIYGRLDDAQDDR
ncbi:hypothetical protein Tco_0491244 [Tanacetum coccineum]